MSFSKNALSSLAFPFVVFHSSDTIDVCDDGLKTEPKDGNEPPRSRTVETLPRGVRGLLRFQQHRASSPTRRERRRRQVLRRVRRHHPKEDGIAEEMERGGGGVFGERVRYLRRHGIRHFARERSGGGADIPAQGLMGNVGPRMVLPGSGTSEGFIIIIA